LTMVSSFWCLQFWCQFSPWLPIFAICCPCEAGFFCPTWQSLFGHFPRVSNWHLFLTSSL
jgi:hypothetical protein